ncbi:MAG: leucine-rich repeat domain-containing protein, partial [Oscillospiraceae bacterium]
SYVVESPNATMSVRGTIFTVEVFFDIEGLCHTVVEVREGVVELEEKGTGNNEIKTLNAGETTEVVSFVEEENNEIQLPSDNGGNSQPPIFQESVMKDAEALAVEQAIEAYLNGGALDTTNFDRITKLELHGKVAFVVLDGYRFGRAMSCSTYMYYNTNDLINGKIGLRFYDENYSVVLDVETARNPLTDLEFIKEMTSLNHLYVEFGSLTTLSALKDMTKLTTLTIDDCKISDITPLSDLSKLCYLNLGNNDISDITPLSNLTNLKTLYLSDNKIADISPLSNLSELYSLYLEMNSVSDITPLADLKELNDLFLGRNNISDITPLANLTEIESLYLDGNNIYDISPLENLLKLNSLNLFSNKFSDISSLANLSNLNSLNLGYNNISDITPLANLTELAKLYLDNITIPDYSPLFDLPKLDTLSIIGASDEVLNQIKQSMPNTQIKN